MYQDLENQIRGHSTANQALQAQAAHHLTNLQKEIGYRETEIARLEGKVKDREQHVDAALVSNTVNKKHIGMLVSTNSEKDERIRELEKKLADT